MTTLPYCITDQAGADLSDALYKLLAVNSAGYAVLANAGGNGAQAGPFGVCAYPVHSGGAVSIAVLGPQNVLAGGSIAPGQFITSNSVGTAVVAASGDLVIGQALEAAASGGVFKAFINRPFRLVGIN